MEIHEFPRSVHRTGMEDLGPYGSTFDGRAQAFIAASHQVWYKLTLSGPATHLWRSRIWEQPAHSLPWLVAAELAASRVCAPTHGWQGLMVIYSFCLWCLAVDRQLFVCIQRLIEDSPCVCRS